jgi:RimJ/RimL family protein N-acetyltransferase
MRRGNKSGPPKRIRLDETPGDAYVLRLFRTGDAKLLALAVGESLEHLRPWMPWADDQAADERFQRQRLRGVQHKGTIDEEWQYGLFPIDESRVLGSFGLMTRQGKGTIEIGYWVHVDEIGHGLATRASRVLTNVALAMPGVTTVYIRCDERNVASAAVPRRLGFGLEQTISRAPEAPGESGQLMIWARRFPIS